MADESPDDRNGIDEDTKKIRKFQEEKFLGKLSENDAKCLLRLNNWDPDAAFKDFRESDIKDLKEKICDGDMDKVVGLKKDAVLRALEEKNDPGKPQGTVKRQYACNACDRVWWYTTPARKPVSKCRVCKAKYDAIPEDKMYGWAIFQCECGNEFSGFGQMGVTASECYVYRGGCGRMVYPARINPPNNRHRRKSRAQHSCNAPDCFNCMGSNRGRGAAGRGRGGNNRSRCVHPKSREMSEDKKKVLYSSDRHVSTGSTVATYLTQDDQISLTSSYIADLETIEEDVEN